LTLPKVVVRDTTTVLQIVGIENASISTANNNLASALDLAHHHTFCNRLDDRATRDTSYVNVNQTDVLDTTSKICSD